MCSSARARQRGVTIVELLVVLVVIVILAVTSMTLYRQAQKDSRDDKRRADIETITAALEAYYRDNNEYPASGGSTLMESPQGQWSTSADASWSSLQTALVPRYLEKLPEDPLREKGKSPYDGGQAYGYYASFSDQCGALQQQMFIIAYNLENGTQETQKNGSCVANLYGENVSSSMYRMSRISEVLTVTTAVQVSDQIHVNEGGAKALDGSSATKWLARSNTAWIIFSASAPVMITRYNVSSANDAPSRDPRSWTLYGSNDRLNWTQLDAQSDQSFSARYTANFYNISGASEYQHYKLDITQNSGDGYTQLSEVGLQTPSGGVTLLTE